MEKDVVELLYKLLHWTMKHEIVTVEEARAAHFKKVEAARVKREKEEAIRMEEEKQKMLKRRSNKTAMPILLPEPKSPEPEPTDGTNGQSLQRSSATIRVPLAVDHRLLDTRRSNPETPRPKS